MRGVSAGIVDWLAARIAVAPPVSATASADEIAAEIGNMVAAVARQLDGDHAQRAALADHFFCGLLAEIAHKIQQVDDAVDAAIEQLVSAVIEQRSADDRLFLPDVVIKLAVQAVAAGLKEIVSRLALVGHLDDVQRAVRMLAVLMCPAPEKHRAVVVFCIEPLDQQVVTQTVRRRLEISMPHWMTASPDGQLLANL